MKRNVLGLLLSMALASAACSASAEPEQSTTASASTSPSSASSTATTTTSMVTSTSTLATQTDRDVMFDRGRCPFSVPAGTDPECGVVSVPQDRNDPDGLEIDLAVAVFDATVEEQHPPVIYLEGGPGGEALDALEFSYTDRFAVLNQHRTVVLFDQRGIGHSEPALDCPEIGEAVIDLLDDVIDTPEVIERQLAALEPCRERWAAAGVKLEHYNSAASALDVADIRRALSIDEWDLFGVSYGTRLALTVMRDVPAGVRAVILDSTYPPEVDGVASIPSTADRALNELYDACSSSDRCTDAYGDLETLLFSVVDKLNVEPAEVVVTDLFTAERHDALIDGDSLLGLIFQSLYSERLFASVPEMLLDAQNGRFTLMERLVSLELANLEFLAIGQNFSVQCHEEVPYADPDAVAAASEAFPRLATLVDGAFTQSIYAFEFCPTWGAGVGDPIEALAVDSGIPTLVVAGQFDPITPPSFGNQVAARLTNAFFVEYPGLGHGVAVTEGCPIFVTLSFLEDPGTEPDSSCTDHMQPPEFSVFAPSSGALDLAPREVELLGSIVTVDAPADWEYIGFGAFYRDSESVDETALLVQGYADESFEDLLLAQFGEQLSEDGELDEVAPITVAGRTWRRFAEMALGLQVEFALYAGDGTTLVVAVFADPREAEDLFDEVFLPALESIEFQP